MCVAGEEIEKEKAWGEEEECVCGDYMQAEAMTGSEWGVIH